MEGQGKEIRAEGPHVVLSVSGTLHESSEWPVHVHGDKTSIEYCQVFGSPQLIKPVDVGLRELPFEDVLLVHCIPLPDDDIYLFPVLGEEETTT